MSTTTAKLQDQPVTYRQLFAYFLPLALQGFSASFNYPLIAMVASRGPGGAINHAAMSQAHSTMFFLGTLLSYGLVTTGMVYGKTRQGFNQFFKVNTLLTVCLGIFQFLLSLPLTANFILGTLIGLPPSIAEPARWILLYSIPVHLLFVIRNPYQVILYNHKSTGKASFATMLRIILTMMLAPVFVFFGKVGPFWATVCLTVPTIIEVVLSWYFAYPFLKNLPDNPHEQVKPLHELIRFNLVLSLGGGFIWLSQIILGSFIVRSPDPERIAPIYYVAAGIVNALASGAGRIQNVALSFPPKNRHDQKTLYFSIMVGLMLGVLILALLIPPVAKWYFIQVQRLQPEDLPLIYATVIAFLLCPLTVSLRARLEGLVAYKEKPGLFLAGQLVYLGVLTASGFILSALKFPGNLLGPLGFIATNLITAYAFHYLLTSSRQLRKLQKSVTGLWKR